MSAAVISLRAYQRPQAEWTFRQQAHQQLDLFLDQWEASMAADPEKPPTLLQLSEGLRQGRGALTGGLLQAYVSKTFASYLVQAQATCPGW